MNTGRNPDVLSNPQQGLKLVGLCMMGAGIVWWAIVYAQVMNNTGFPVQRTLPCLLYTSDRCSLAMSLCKNWHFLGIKRYSVGLLWAGAAVCAAAFILRAAVDYLGQTRKKNQS